MYRPQWMWISQSYFYVHILWSLKVSQWVVSWISMDMDIWQVAATTCCGNRWMLRRFQVHVHGVSGTTQKVFYFCQSFCMAYYFAEFDFVLVSYIGIRKNIENFVHIIHVLFVSGRYVWDHNAGENPPLDKILYYSIPFIFMMLCIYVAIISTYDSVSYDSVMMQGWYNYEGNISKIGNFLGPFYTDTAHVPSCLNRHIPVEYIFSVNSDTSRFARHGAYLGSLLSDPKPWTWFGFVIFVHISTVDLWSVPLRPAALRQQHQQRPVLLIINLLGGPTPFASSILVYPITAVLESQNATA